MICENCNLWLPGNVKPRKYCHHPKNSTTMAYPDKNGNLIPEKCPLANLLTPAEAAEVCRGEAENFKAEDIRRELLFKAGCEACAQKFEKMEGKENG